MNALRNVGAPVVRGDERDRIPGADPWHEPIRAGSVAMADKSDVLPDPHRVAPRKWVSFVVMRDRAR